MVRPKQSHEAMHSVIEVNAKKFLNYNYHEAMGIMTIFIHLHANCPNELRIRGGGGRPIFFKVYLKINYILKLSKFPLKQVVDRPVKK